MRTFKSVLFCLCLVAPIMAADSGSIDLLSFAMPDAKIIAGANVDAAKMSAFGQYVLSQMQSDNPALQKFIQDTGVDPRNDIKEVLVATDGTPGPGFHALVAAHGKFGNAIAALESAAKANGGTVTNLTGIDLIRVDQAQANVCVALYLDGQTALAGDCDTLQAAIGVAAKSSADTSLQAAARILRGAQDLWFTSVAPMGQFANTVPGGLNPVLNSALIQAIQQTSGGVKLSAGTGGVPAVQLSGNVLMDTPQNATSLLNVVNFFAGMIQMNSGATGMPAALQGLLSTFQATATGNTLNVSLTIPEATLEQLFQQMHQQASAGRSGVHDRHRQHTVQ